ncbi:MAG TPA: hypothetical protein VNA57_02095 [Acidimicrobiales bacterium]|nr:hypothetical protein [Acidimicrobiales bacterium]
MAGGADVSDWRDEAVMYGRYVAALFRPGHRVPTFDVYRIVAGDMAGWSAEELRLLVEEGRRQVDRHARELERIQSRAQFLFTTALALLIVLAAAGRRVATSEGVVMLLVWGLGTAVVAAGMLGASSLLAVRAEVSGIETALLSTQAPGGVLEALARSYAGMMSRGESSVATRLTLIATRSPSSLSGPASTSWYGE